MGHTSASGGTGSQASTVSWGIMSARSAVAFRQTVPDANRKEAPTDRSSKRSMCLVGRGRFGGRSQGA